MWACLIKPPELCAQLQAVSGGANTHELQEQRAVRIFPQKHWDQAKILWRSEQSNGHLKDESTGDGEGRCDIVIDKKYIHLVFIPYSFQSF